MNNSTKEISNLHLADELISNRLVIVIGGATASGKTDLSISLNKYIPIEIISADSRQVYKYMDIGTAKPTQQEREIVEHHLIDFLEPNEYYSAGVYALQARKVIDKIFAKQKIPVVVGGSGLYIKALCEGLFDDGIEDNNLKLNQCRNELEKILIDKGIEALYKELYSVDRASAELYKDMNHRRIIRALEYYYSTGELFSNAKEKFQYPEKNFNPVYFAINWNRNELYNRINLRTQKMWESGLLDELKNILGLGYSRNLNSLNTVGYKEIFDYLDSKTTEIETINLIAQHTRNYAKRQITWFKKVPEMNWIINNSQEIIRILLQKISK